MTQAPSSTKAWLKAALTSLSGSLFNAPKAVLIGLVRGYRLLLSPSLGSACRFTPTCSAYALDALAQHGATGGSYLTVARLARCHPWCAGGLDQVPQHITAPKLFTRWLEKPASESTCVAAPPTSAMPAASTDSLYSTPVSKTLL
jgi:uncharacterized protein